MSMASLWANPTLVRGAHDLGVSRKAFPAALSMLREAKETFKKNTAPVKSCATLHFTDDVL